MHQEQKQCYFCTTNRNVDYKHTDQLGKFMSVQARIYPRKKSGLCGRHQRTLGRAVKLARFLALLPYIKH